MNNINLKGANKEYEFKISSLKKIETLNILNCIIIVASYKEPNVYSMFYIKYLDSIKSLKKIFDIQLDHLLFIRELSKFENAEKIINDIKISNPEHKFDK